MKAEKLKAVPYEKKCGWEGNAQEEPLERMNVPVVEGQGEWTCDYKHDPVDLCHQFRLDPCTIALGRLENSLGKK